MIHIVEVLVWPIIVFPNVLELATSLAYIYFVGYIFKMLQNQNKKENHLFIPIRIN